ncbi:hypothetical protein SRHO_G00122290 [Serrasalmus rhombeus]
MSACHDLSAPAWLLRTGLAAWRGHASSAPASPACASSQATPGHLAPLPAAAGQINGRRRPSRMTKGRHQRPPARRPATWCSVRVMEHPAHPDHRHLLSPSAG